MANVDVYGLAGGGGDGGEHGFHEMRNECSHVVRAGLGVRAAFKHPVAATRPHELHGKEAAVDGVAVDFRLIPAPVAPEGIIAAASPIAPVIRAPSPRTPGTVHAGDRKSVV